MIRSVAKKRILRFPLNWLRIRCWSVFWFAYSFREAFGYIVKSKLRWLFACSWSWRKGFLGMQGTRLDQHTVEIQHSEELTQNCSLVVLAGGVTGLADRHL